MVQELRRKHTSVWIALAWCLGILIRPGCSLVDDRRLGHRPGRRHVTRDHADVNVMVLERDEHALRGLTGAGIQLVADGQPPGIHGPDHPGGGDRGAACAPRSHALVPGPPGAG